ncbi:MAG: FAD/NAD(P)-binding protein [Sedimentisphaerales bacterium]|jgi:NAD(P)H-flavin reductase|nr:FAD/NAD(P)-binding protein [Sedimentisphaerales bacterium]NLZ06349.1 oxidoreductase [Phycisphaerae bacterium]HNY79111.1 FAD/NAD(P)-binding protein [Sedimentisphaerales bacterium]HOC64397.1 FAD/NAD(P)-binding protein [Sedimentisphaerales bacterium]HOH65167.1 FAD/NAD(P)-binding protein [Sedimentisphaerales bacterium]
MCQCCTEKKDIYLPQLATVVKAEAMNVTERYLRLSMDDGQFDYIPGQFVEVSVAGIGEAPITITSSPTQKGGFELVIRKIGNVTNAVHNLREGAKIGIRGPLGDGTYPVEEAKGKNLVFICGGLGLVPQRAFINYVLDNRKDYGEVTILQGTKCYEQRLFVKEVAAWEKRSDVHMLETIDEGHDCWKGNVGVVTKLIPKVKTDLKSAVVLVCGPPVMYKFVLMALEEYEVPHENIFLNLERKMKCGVGKCGHCQINGVYCCMDGPVFRYSDLATMPEAI